MDVTVQGAGSPAPFLGARDLFETERDLDQPVTVTIREDPDERTWVGHDESGHVLNISQQAASSAMARELALHEYAHMSRHEEGHPSHIQSTEEALYLALAGQRVNRATLTQCYQIANHMKDIYADDITLEVAPADKLIAFLESSLAAAVADRPTGGFTWQRLTGAVTPEITAVNAAFALALVERHDLVGPDHRLYDIAHAAGADAPTVRLDRFKRHFRSLGADPTESQYRKALVTVTQEFADQVSQAGK
jgi:hypothetical protein